LPCFYVDQNDLAVFSGTEDVVATWKDLQMNAVVHGIELAGCWVWLFTGRLDEASAEIAALLQVKEADVAVREAAHKEWFELVHRDA